MNLELTKHFKPQKGWMNDPNGLVEFRGQYHAFFQHTPNHEVPWKEPMCWGHAVTKDFINWTELPIALAPSEEYDNNGCWSGTAIVKDDVLYLIYASIHGEEKTQTVSVAYSNDGINFTKYEKNPVIANYPDDGAHDFRDPALIKIGDKYRCIMATGNKEMTVGRLLIYESEDLLNWNYIGVLSEWNGPCYCECPSFVKCGEKYILATSLAYEDDFPEYSIMYGDFKDNKYTSEIRAKLMMGPDQYAGQIFNDSKGRSIMMAWFPGWAYSGFADKSIGALSLPIELSVRNGKICGFPIKEVQHLLQDSDPSVEITNTGFRVKRTFKEDVVFEGKIDDIKIVRDNYMLEIFINRGELVYMVVLC